MDKIGFIKLLRSQDTRELFKHPAEFVLLALIAFRAKRTASFSALGLEPGEALIGDYEACGLTRQQYRTAKKNLEKWNLVACKPTNKGTIVKLINLNIFDPNIDDANHQINQMPTANQPSFSHQPTTIKNLKNLKNKKKIKKESGRADFDKLNYAKEYENRIIDKCKQLYALARDTGSKFNPYKWAHYSLKTKRRHPGLVMETLDGIETYWDDIEDHWGYAEKICITKEPSWRERKAIEQSEIYKKFLSEASNKIDLN